MMKICHQSSIYLALAMIPGLSGSMYKFCDSFTKTNEMLSFLTAVLQRLFWPATVEFSRCCAVTDKCGAAGVSSSRKQSSRIVAGFVIASDNSNNERLLSALVKGFHRHRLRCTFSHPTAALSVVCSRTPLQVRLRYGANTVQFAAFLNSQPRHCICNVIGMKISQLIAHSCRYYFPLQPNITECNLRFFSICFLNLTAKTVHHFQVFILCIFDGLIQSPFLRTVKSVFKQNISV